MIDKKQYRGYWWLPESPENPAGGIASFSPEDGVKLELFSTLNNDIEGMNPGSVFRPDYIHGTSLDGTDITLKNCIRSNYSMSQAGGSQVTNSDYQAISLLEGVHFSDEIEFDRFRIEFPLLGEWAGITGVGYTPDQSSDGTLSVGDSFEVTYTIPEPVDAEVNNIEIRVLTSADTNIQRIGGAEIDESTFFEVSPNEEKMSYSDSMKYMRLLQDFVTLGTGKEARPSSLIGGISQQQRGMYTDVNIMFSVTNNSNVDVSLHPLRANFILADIEENFGEIIENWISDYEELEPVYNLYFGSKYNENIYVGNNLLTLTQAIETYHRREYGGQYLSEGEFEDFYETMVDSIPENIEDGFRAHIEHGTLRYSNEYSLRKRLSILISRHESILSELPLEIASSVEEIVNTRNYLTHYEEEITPRADQDEYPKLVAKLQALLETILLSRVGIADEQIVERLSRRYQNR